MLGLLQDGAQEEDDVVVETYLRWVLYVLQERYSCLFNLIDKWA